MRTKKYPSQDVDQHTFAKQDLVQQHPATAILHKSAFVVVAKATVQREGPIPSVFWIRMRRDLHVAVPEFLGMSGNGVTLPVLQLGQGVVKVSDRLIVIPRARLQSFVDRQITPGG